MNGAPRPADLGDIDEPTARDALRDAANWAADYRDTIRDRPIRTDVAAGDVTRHLSTSLPDHATSITELLAEIDGAVMPGIVHWGHPSFLGYFGSSSNTPALVGEIIAAALNVSAMTWRTCPAATELETLVLQWIRDLIGLPATFSGIVYDTASVAVLHALAAARERAAPGIRERGLVARDGLTPFRLYASDQAHSSLEKAAIMLGIGESNVVRVTSDDSFQLDPSALRYAIERDAGAGLRPLAVVATLGTTSTASVDPITQIADVCAAHNVWLHVDAAYGGAFAALSECHDMMEGVERADSFVVNGHKALFIPLDFSALYVRRPEELRRVFSLVPEYLRGDASSPAESAEANSNMIDYMDYGVQLGRRFRALKAWMVFRAFGSDGITARLRELRRLALLVAHWIALEPHFELMAPVSMAVVCFRFNPGNMESAATDALNVAIVQNINASGDAYLTHTTLRGRKVMRIGIGNIATTERDVEAVWHLIVRTARTLVAAD